MAIFKNNPPVVTDGLVYALDAANPFCTPRAGIPQIIGISYSNVSNGTNTAVTTTLPDGTTGNCTKLAEGTYASGQTIMNEGYSCPGSSTFSMFVKPDGINYIRIRDGDTTNLQVNFDLITGTITGGNNTANATIEAYPNGWFLISMTIFRGGAFGYGTRTVLSPDGTFTNHASTPGAGIFMFQRTMKTIPNNFTSPLSNLNISNQLFNGTSFNRSSGGSFIFDGIDDYIAFNAPNLSTTTTVEMWAKIGAGYSNKMFFGWLRYDVWCGNSHLGYNTGNGDIYGISSTTVSSLGLVNNWRHYIFEMRSDVPYTNNKIYIDNNLLPISQIQGSENASNRNFNSGNGRIAIWGNDLAYCMPMECPIFKVYNRALTPTEIQQNYTALKRRFGL
jgi:hypothetical protein